MLWRMREELGAAMRSEGKVVRNDISVPVGTVPELIARGRELMAGLVPNGRLLPFGHLGSHPGRADQQHPQQPCRDPSISTLPRHTYPSVTP